MPLPTSATIARESDQAAIGMIPVGSHASAPPQVGVTQTPQDQAPTSATQEPDTPDILATPTTMPDAIRDAPAPTPGAGTTPCSTPTGTSTAPGSTGPWSYHTFILPFVAQVPQRDDSGRLISYPAVFISADDLEAAKPTERRRRPVVRPADKPDQFHKIPLNSNHWVSTSWLDDQPPAWLTGNMGRPEMTAAAAHRLQRFEAGDDLFDAYNSFQFFTDAARDLVFGRKPTGDPQLVRQFELLPDGRPLADCHYLIDWTEQTPPGRVGPPRHFHYDLDLTRVRLLTYNTKVSILVLETQYSGDEHSLDDIRRINEYGRRICYPYLHRGLVRTLGDQQRHGHPRVADSISITGLTSEADPIRSDFIFQTRSGDWTGYLEFQYVMEPIKSLLSHWTFGYVATSSTQQALNRPRGSRGFVVAPVMDSRMFTCCLYRNDAIAEAASAYDPDSGDYAICSARPEDDDIANAFYAYAFVDTGRPTIQNRSLRASIMRDCVYQRWADDGVLHVVTDRSYMVLIKASPPSMEFAVIRPFRTFYTDMVLLAIAQKASIMQMTARAADLADRFDQVGATSETDSSDIARLEQGNALMQNQVILTEVTTTSMGFELFAMMRQSQSLDTANAELIEQLEYLYQMDSARGAHRQRIREARTNWSLNAMAMGLGLLAIPSTLISYFSTDNYWARLFGGLSFLLFTAIFALMMLGLWRRGRRRRARARQQQLRH
ncbi:MAG: hypothetical protein LBV30_09595 [Propionibacteriaceae bacterium]|jgi:hypothetical protein|nr:hypothetical protein [Propionibacteriaceae bacterium]